MSTQSICLVLVVAIVCQSCMVWEKNPISIQETVDIGSVKITTGNHLTLRESVGVGNVIVKRKGHPNNTYLNITRDDSLYHGKTYSSDLELISQDSIITVIPTNTLNSKEYRGISYSDGQYYGMFNQPELLDTAAIHAIHKKKSDEPNAWVVLGTLAGATIVGAVLLIHALNRLGGGR